MISAYAFSKNNLGDAYRILQFLNHVIITCLKIPKGESEPVHRRGIDNTMAKRKSTKGQTAICKTYI